MTKVKPCPFCGSSYADVYRYGKIYTIICGNCNACIGNCESKAEAVKAWNTRTERTCRPKFFDNLRETDGDGDAWAVCSECGWLLCVLTEEQAWPRYCPGCGAKVVDE